MQQPPGEEERRTMKNSFKRLTALLLALCMTVALLPTGAWAAQTDGNAVSVSSEAAAEEPPEIVLEEAEDNAEPVSSEETAEAQAQASLEEGQSDAGQVETEVYLNPLYADVMSQADLEQPDKETLLTATQASTYYSSVSKAAASLRQSMENRQKNVTLGYKSKNKSAYSSKTAKTIFATALEHTGVPTQGDYLMWQYGGWYLSYSYYTSGATYYITFTYRITYYSTAAQEQKVSSRLNTVLSGLKLSGKSDYEKTKAIYDYICTHVTYDFSVLSNPNNVEIYTAYAALIKGTAVCQGYALLFYRMALEAGLDARLIAGYGAGEPHGWNIVRLDGVYYHVDSTWDAGMSTYSFFLKGSEDFPYHIRNQDYSTAAFKAAYPMAVNAFSLSTHTGHSHAYTQEVTPNTFNQQGYTTYTCTVCGFSYQGDYVDIIKRNRIIAADINLSSSTKKQTVSIVAEAKGGTMTYAISGDSQIKVDKTTGKLTIPANFVGKASVTITAGAADYETVSETITVKVNPAKVTISSLKSSSKKQLTLKWKKSAGAGGYEIQYDTSSTFKNPKTLRVNSASTLSKTIKGLTSGKKYYVRIRAIKAVNGQQFSSAWSKKSVKAA